MIYKWRKKLFSRDSVDLSEMMIQIKTRIGDDTEQIIESRQTFILWYTFIILSELCETDNEFSFVVWRKCW